MQRVLRNLCIVSNLWYTFLFSYLPLRRKKKKLKPHSKNPFRIWRKLFTTLGEKFCNMPSADDYMKEVQNLKNKMVLRDGYEIIIDPLKITKSGTQ